MAFTCLFFLCFSSPIPLLPSPLHTARGGRVGESFPRRGEEVVPGESSHARRGATASGADDTTKDIAVPGKANAK